MGCSRFICDARVSPVQSPRDDGNWSSARFARDFGGFSFANAYRGRRRPNDGRGGARDLVRPVSAVELLVTEIRVRDALITRLTRPLRVGALTSGRRNGAVSLVPSVSAVVIAVASPDLHNAFSSPSAASALVLIRFTLVISVSAALRFVGGILAIGPSVAEACPGDTFARSASVLPLRALSRSTATGALADERKSLAPLPGAAGRH